MIPSRFWQALEPAVAAVLGLARSGVRRLDGLPLARSTLGLAVGASLFGWSPAFAGLSYPSALIVGLCVPSVTVLSTSHLDASSVASPEQLFAKATRRALAHALAVTVPFALHALRVGFCAPLHDATLWLLGPLLGIWLAALWGTSVRLAALRLPAIANRRGALTALGLAGPLGNLLVEALGFYVSPVVFAFDPFLGFFAGSLYDTGFDVTERLLTYRVGSLGTLLCSVAILRQLEFDELRRPILRRQFDRAMGAIGLGGLAVSGFMTANSEAFYHGSSTQAVRRELTESLRFGRCELLFGARQDRLEIERLGRDCDAWLTRLERRLEAPALDHVGVFLFDDPGQKERLMGASQTQIAKPWRQEIYLNMARAPHETMGHELAHVVAGKLAPGPFAVAGSLYGLIPNPGLIEGLAVAVAPDEDAELTHVQWARALKELGKLPSLEGLFSLGFYGHSGSLAYTVAGAFVDFVGQRYGKRAVAAWYAGASLEGATRASRSTVERGFLEALDGVQLPDNARLAARARFARPGVLSRHCPHAIDRLLWEAELRLSVSDAAESCRLFQRAAELDPKEVRATFGLAACLDKSGKPKAALSQYEAIVQNTEFTEVSRSRAEERIADRLMRDGQVQLAQAMFRRLAQGTVDPDRRRTLELKGHVASPEARAALGRLLFEPSGEASWDLAVRDLMRWAEAEPESGIADYLLGRNFAQRGYLEAGAEHLDRALARKIELPSIRAEALRQRAILACNLGDKATAKSLTEQLKDEAAFPLARRLGIVSLVERCVGGAPSNDWPNASGGRAFVEPPRPSPKKALAWDSEDFTCPTGMEKIPGGIFWVGSRLGKGSPDEAPRFQTRVRGFCLDATEVTVDAYRDCQAKGKCTKPSEISVTCNATYDDRGNHPVNCVDHEQAVAFCQQRPGGRLPSEIEWEYAARGGARALKYPWGDESPDGHACWKHHMTCPVKSFAPGAFGLFDLSGNVWEWTSSDYGDYPFPRRPGETLQKVYRGGSWSRRFEKWMHVGLRNRWNIHKTGAHLGFRCAKSPPLGCPFGERAPGECLAGVLAADCPVGETWNGVRCARPNAPECEEGMHVEPGYGCVRDIPMAIMGHDPDAKPVKRMRSPQFDEDCRTNQPDRPRSFRYYGGEHEGRNLAARRDGCRNRDVGDGWNSTCCP